MTPINRRAHTHYIALGPIFVSGVCAAVKVTAGPEPPRKSAAKLVAARAFPIAADADVLGAAQQSRSRPWS
jgi:hypothetical protein